MFKLLKTTYQSLSRGEKKFIFWLILIALFISSLPVLYGWISTPAGFYYPGFTVIAGADKMVYLSQIAEAETGQIFLHNLYTAEAARALIFSPVWLVLGWFAKLTFLSPLFVFHFFRIIFGGLFLYLLYLLIAKCFKEVIFRKIVFFIFCFGSGLGVFALNYPWSDDNIFITFGTDMWVSEGNTFLTIYHSPLFILSQIFILLIFWWLIERLDKAGWLKVLGVGLATLLLGIFHPYDLVTVYSVAGVWLLAGFIREKRIFWLRLVKILMIILISSLALAYFFWLKSVDPSFAGWAVQNITLSPGFFNFAIGYGLVFVFFLFGIIPAFKKRDDYWFFLAIWATVGWFLIFAPLPFQRRLANGLHLPMALIAVLGLSLVLRFLAKFQVWQIWAKLYFVRVSLLMVGGFLLTTSTIYVVGQDLLLLEIKSFPYYLSDNIYQGLCWLKDNTLKSELILTNNVTGTFVPTLAGRKVWLGHGHQTSDYVDKKSYLENIFFAGNKGDGQKKAWLKKTGIAYLFYSNENKNLSGNFNPFQKDYLELVWQEGQTAIFKVKAD
ncbi:MAG: hypothetical protein NTZ18_00185 [Candidatus Komeilibacteria bacterium]|nr:hypothetical protein [Candidatus Komeilibacteria bacterium]